MNSLMVMLIRNTRRAIRESADEMNLNAPFAAIFREPPNRAPGDRRNLAQWHAISGAHFMQLTAMVGDIQ